MTPITFTCACCGKAITGMPDIAFDAPDYYHGVPEAERGDRAKLDSDLCVVDDEHYFIRAVCPIPITGTDEQFSWGVWVSLSSENFARYAETFDRDDQSGLGEMFGWLCNSIAGYPSTLHLQTTVVPQDGNQRPLVWINDAHADHPLYGEQRDGVGRDRLGEFYAARVCDRRDA